MSLLDILKPPAAPTRKGKLVSQAKRDLAAEKRKAETLAKYEEAQRATKVAAHAERMKALHADPTFKAAHAERMKALHADPTFKAKLSASARERMKALHADPTFKQRREARKLATLEKNIEKMKAKLLAARKVAVDEEGES